MEYIIRENIVIALQRAKIPSAKETGIPGTSKSSAMLASSTTVVALPNH